MYNLSDLTTIKRILKKYGFSFSKSLGQNFLINEDVCPRMAEECVGDKSWGVIEIGPGIGVLTVELAKRAERVISIELDKNLLPILDDTLRDFDNVKILNQDVLKCDLNKVARDEFGDRPFAICANLPYYITSEVIMKILEKNVPCENITVMVQKEAAQRLCAEPGTREVGAISIAVRYYTEPEVLFDVSRESFVPIPNVDSSVIKLVLTNKNENFENKEILFKIVRAAFSQRRKVIVNSLANGLNLNKERVMDVLEKCCVKSDSRAEQLTLDDFVRLASAFEKIK